jgi:hypothetical protein
MDIKSIFRGRADTIESVVRKHQDLSRQKADLEKKSEAIRREALNTDVSNLSGRLADIRSQLELSKTAIAETEKQLKRALEKKIETDFAKLPQEQQKYEQQLADLSKESGRSLGEAVKSLQSLNLSFARNLGEMIRKEIVNFSEDRRFKNQMDGFLQAYSQQINVESDTVNFRNWKKEIARAENLQPGSIETQRHIQGQIRRLLSA